MTFTAIKISVLVLRGKGNLGLVFGRYVKYFRKHTYLWDALRRQRAEAPTLYAKRKKKPHAHFGTLQKP